MKEFVVGLVLQLWTALLLCGRVVLQENRLTTEEETLREVQLCNGTFNSSLLDSPILLTLPPIPPLTHDRPLYCRYTFFGTDPFKVSLRLTRLHAGIYNNGSHSCSEGYLRIWDGSRDPGRHLYPPNTFCGNYGNSAIDVEKISTRGYAEMDFLASGVGFVPGFRVIVRYINIAKEEHLHKKQIQHSMQLVEDTSSVCFWRVHLEDCEHECPLLSPGYPGIYPPNTECYYHVTSQNPHVTFQLRASGSSMSGKPREFNLRHSCGKNFLDIYDSDTNKDMSTRIGHFCGHNLPDITTSTNNLFLVFSSGEDVPPYSYTGFHISAAGVTKEWHQDAYHQPDSICGWIFNATEGSVSSPEHWLPPRATCEYGFHVSPGHYLEIIINIYGLQRNCQDYIIVMDGERILSEICDHALRQSRQTFIFNLTSPYVLVRYYTIAGQMEGQQTRGFWLSFRQIYDPNTTQPPTESPEKPQPVIHYEVVNTGPSLRHQTKLPIILLVPLFSIFVCHILSSL